MRVSYKRVGNGLVLMSKGSDRIQLLLRNAKQMKRIVEATYPSLDFSNEGRDITEECSSPKVLHWTVGRRV